MPTSLLRYRWPQAAHARLRSRSSIPCWVATKSCTRAAWLCPPLRSTPASLAPTRSVPFPGRCTVVRRPRGGRPLPRGTSCAAPPQAVLTLRQALVGFLQAEALRLQGAVFLQPAVDAFQTIVERFVQRLPSVGLRLRVGGRQHSEEGLHLNGCAHCFSLLLAF